MKSFVIHGMTRSGGTMLERLFDSQEGIACFPFLFNIPEIIHVLNDDPLLNVYAGDTVEERKLNNLRRVLLARYAKFIAHICNKNPYKPKDMEIDVKTLVSGVPVGKIIDGIKLISLSRSIDQLLAIEQRLGHFFGLRMLGTHCTKSYECAPAYLEKENAYWIELIRNPYERISSEVLAAPMGKIGDILRKSDQHYRFAKEFSHDRYMVVKYEDICEQTDRELERISDFLGEEIKTVPLKNIYGNPFYPNTSQTVLKGGHFMDQDASHSSRIATSGKGKWLKRLPRSSVAMINARVDAGNYYPKIDVGLIDQIKGLARLLVIEGREALRNLIVWMFRIIGLEISRKDPKSSRLFGSSGLKIRH